jgi:hypothetical protein
MIRRPRLLRWLAALLLIASPAFGGQLLAAVHPCPVADAIPGVVGEASQLDAHQHHGTSSGAEDQAPEHADCSCIGTCQAPFGQLASPEPDITAVVAPHLASAPLDNTYAAPPIGVPLDRLPPKTAPPRD